jgi:hypothetical protein
VPSDFSQDLSPHRTASHLASFRLHVSLGRLVWSTCRRVPLSFHLPPLSPASVNLPLLSAEPVVNFLSHRAPAEPFRNPSSFPSFVSRLSLYLAFRPRPGDRFGCRWCSTTSFRFFLIDTTGWIRSLLRIISYLLILIDDDDFCHCLATFTFSVL